MFSLSTFTCRLSLSAPCHPQQQARSGQALLSVEGGDQDLLSVEGGDQDLLSVEGGDKDLLSILVVVC